MRNETGMKKAHLNVFRGLFSGWALGALLLATALIAVPARAQDAETRSPAATEPAGMSVANPVVPDAVVNAALLPDGRGAAVVSAFLRGDDLDPRAAARRGIALLQALKAGIIDGSGDYAAAGQMVQRMATEIMSALRVLELGIDRAFQPPGDAVAFDFGPAGGAVRAGFQGTVPGDSRLAGQLRAIGGEGDDSMLSDGIAGISRIVLNLPPGGYRILPITESNNAPSAESPFGREIVVNDEAFGVLPMWPNEWVPSAYLSENGKDFVESGMRPGSGATTANGASLSTMRGGIVVIETVTRAAQGGTGEIVLEFRQAMGTLPFLAGLFVEPSDGPSSLWLTPRARSMLLSADERLSLEAELMAALADLLSSIATAAGPETPPPFFLAIPEFVSPPTVVVSAS